MKLNFDNEKSIYLQIAESIEDDILRDALQEEEQLPSTNQLATLLQINPATAGKGINLLVEEGIVYKKRGIGMFVATGAREKLRAKRKDAFYQTYIVTLLHEAKNLGLTHAELFTLLEKGEKEHG
ncbi:MAG: GntR family transcriptional regulator [Ethanoligenens sp.]